MKRQIKNIARIALKKSKLSFLQSAIAKRKKSNVKLLPAPPRNTSPVAAPEHQDVAVPKHHNVVVPEHYDYDVSVVIPVYRSEEYLEQAIRSVSDLTRCRFEILAMNDESPDGSAALVERLQKTIPQLKLHSHPNMGGANTLNRGLELAKGKYVMFLDGDDWVPPEALDILFDRAEDKGAEVAFGVLQRYSQGEFFDTIDTRDIKTSLDLDIENGKNSHPAIYENSYYSGAVFNRRFLLENDIRFPQGMIYADRPFVVLARTLAKRVVITPHVTAYWRKREDPENPSITDNSYTPEMFSKKVSSYLEVYDRLMLRGLVDEAALVMGISLSRVFWNLDRLVSHEYTTTIAEHARPLIWAAGGLEQYGRLSLKQRLILQQVCWYPPEFVHAYIHCLQRIFVEHKNGPVAVLAEKYRNFPHIGPKTRPKAALDMIKDPEMVVFENNFGRSVGGNPRHIFQQLRRENWAFKPVWVYSEGKPFPWLKGCIQVRRGSLEYYAALSRAKYWVTNIKIASETKPEGTVFLQTWHGTPLKRLGTDITASGPEVEARDDLLAQASRWDYLISPNSYSSEIFRRAFDYTGPVLETGYPSNDLLAPGVIEETAQGVRKMLSIPAGRKVVLYAPTWRDDQRIGNSWQFKFRLQLDLLRLQRYFGETHFFMIRLHHLSSQALARDAFEPFKNFAVNVSSVSDTTQLLAVADVLVTDYSSIFFDYAITGRPMIFYMYDRGVYEDKLRGFYFDPDTELPGPIVEMEGALIAALKSEDYSNYQDRYARFKERFTSLEDGRAGERVVAEVFNDLRVKEK